MLRENIGRVFVILAGGGCLALMFFVVWPQMNEPAPAMTPGEIVEEVLGPEDEQPGEMQAEGDEVMPVPSPLVAVRDDGEGLPVIFPAPEGEIPGAQETGEIAGEVAALPAVLSAEDVAAARAALEGNEEAAVGAAPAAEAVEPVDCPEECVAAAPEPATPEDWVQVASAPDVEPLEPDGGEAVESDDETDAGDAAPADGMGEPAMEVVDVVDGPGEGAEGGAPDAYERMGADQVEAAAETAVPEGVGGPPIVERPLLLVEAEFQVPPEAPDPSGELPGLSALEAGQAGGPESGLPPRMAEEKTEGVIVPGTLRGVMGYRLPLVSRQEVPDQIVSGVLIPAHTTFVILREGWWELVDVSDEELRLLREVAAQREAEEAGAAEAEPEPARRGWNPLRMFRKQGPGADE